MPPSALDALADLVLGSACAGCDRPGRALCPTCRAGLVAHPAVRPPTPCPAGLATPWSAGEYDGVLRRLVVAHKDHGRHALAAPLGLLLAPVVEAVLHGGAGGPAAVLVPVPSHPSVVRERGQDPLLRITRAAAGRVRSGGRPAVVARLLRTTDRRRDQAGLGAEQRAANLAGAYRATPTPWSGGPVLLVDDVVTTGATAREAQRALETAGVPVHAVVALAATRRLGAPARVAPT